MTDGNPECGRGHGRGGLVADGALVGRTLRARLGLAYANSVVRLTTPPRRGRRWLVGLCRWALALVLRGRWRGIDQSEIDPGVVVGGEGGRTGVVGGAGVAGAARDGAGMLDAALGGRSDLMDGVSKGLSSSLCGGLNRVNGGPPGAGG